MKHSKPIKKSDLEPSQENPRNPAADDADLSLDDPKLVKNMRERLLADVGLLRADIEKMHNLQAKALFETAAEVMLGLTKAFSDFENKNEKAWK